MPLRAFITAHARPIWVFVCLVLVASCGTEGPTTPTPVVEPRFTLSGTVTRVGGGPIVGARAELLSGPGGPRSTLSDAQGRYAFAELLPGEFTLRVSATGLLPRNATIALRENQTFDVALDVDPGDGDVPPSDRFRVAGVVRAAADGRAVEAATVEVVSGVGIGQRTESDVEGRYALSGVPAGELRIRATAGGFGAQESTVVLIGDLALDFNLPASPTSPVSRFSISGVVYNSLGLPFGGAEVRVLSGRNADQRSATDSAGRYLLSGLDAGTIDLEASGAGHLPRRLAVTLAADRVEDFRLLASGSTRGRVVDVLSQEGVPNVSITGDGIVSTSADSDGGFQVLATTSSTDVHPVRFSGAGVVERVTTMRVPGGNTLVTLIPASFDLASFDQMLRDPGLARWTSAPPLAIERRVLAFEGVEMSEGTALEATMTEAEADGIGDDLSWALPQLTGGAFAAFSGVSRATAAVGDRVAVLRANVITVARVEGLFEQTGFEGYGRWLVRSDGTVIGGLVMIDRGFDATATPARRVLRAHELGHALGYHHLTRRSSIMSPVGPVAPTPFDLDAFRIAFARVPGNRSPDVDPADRTVNRGMLGPAIWGPPIR